MPNPIDTHAFTVRPSDCDFLGHMNIARYYDACSDAGFTVQSHWGLTRDDVLTGRQVAFVVLSAENKFLRELTIGDHVQVRSRLERIGGKSVHVNHSFWRGDTLVFDCSFALVLMDLRSRAAIVIPDDLRAAIEAAHAD